MCKVKVKSGVLLSDSNSQVDETSFLPEGEEKKATDDENCCKHGEDEVAGSFPTCVVEHFS